MTTDQIEKYLRHFDPSLSASKASDLYDLVAIDFIKRNRHKDFNDFALAMESALTGVYGVRWLQNVDCNKNAMFNVMYSHLFLTAGQGAASNGAWKDGNLLSFEGFAARDIIEGETYYYEDSHDNGLRFEGVNIPKEFVRIQLGENLGVAIDQYGRLLYPDHLLDNLYLSHSKRREVKIPSDSIPGKIYLLRPDPQELDDLAYYSMPGLDPLAYDENHNLIQFGSKVGEKNLEIARNFILSLSSNKIVGAWVKIRRDS